MPLYNTETCSEVDVPSPSYETVEYNSDGHKTSLTVNCVNGYHTPSSSTVTCSEGSWENSLPECGMWSVSVILT